MQVMLSPHSAFLTREALANICATTIENMYDFATGKPLSNELVDQPKV